MPPVQKQYSNLHVSTIGKDEYRTGLWSRTSVATGPEGNLSKVAHSYLFSDSSLHRLVETFRFPHSPLKLTPNPSARLP